MTTYDFRTANDKEKNQLGLSSVTLEELTAKIEASGGRVERITPNNGNVIVKWSDGSSGLYHPFKPMHTKTPQRYTYIGKNEDEIPVGKNPLEIAHRAGGSERRLVELLKDAGATLIKTREGGHNPNRTQYHVQWPDGSVGFFDPGGPSHRISYRYVEYKNPQSTRALRWPTTFAE